jgi:prepilin-type N-terminal cleavage/methylation domain-containing protein
MARTLTSPGFTLVEMVLAMSLGAVLVISLAHASGLFGAQTKSVTSSTDLELEQALAEINRTVATSWLAEQVSSDELRVFDALGGATTFFRDGSDLKVTRPSGVTGVLLTEVHKLEFGSLSGERLREDTALGSYGLFQDVQPLGSASPLAIKVLGDPPIDDTSSPYYDPAPVPGVLESNDELSIGFTVGVQAPESVDSVDGVEEKLQEVALGRLLLPIATLASLPPIPAKFEPGSEIICHYPPGNPEHPFLIRIGAPAVDDHLTHGDNKGGCIPGGGPGGAAALLEMSLYEARGPDDARPYGALLGTLALPTAALPTASYKFSGIKLSPEVSFDNPALVMNTPSKLSPIDLTRMGAVLTPGVPYTLVLRYTGSGVVIVGAYDVASVVASAVATRREGEAQFAPQAHQVEFALDGMRSFTQTTRHEVTELVTTMILRDDGTRLSSSSAVTAQVASSERWHGQVPGEFPVFELDGQ